MKRICKDCGYHGRMITDTRGSFIMEVILWLFLIIPGVLYSLWRLTTKHKACPECKSRTLIPLDSPAGKKLVVELDIKIKG